MDTEQIKALIDDERYMDVVKALNASYPNGEHEVPDDLKSLLNSYEDVEFMHYPDYLWCFGERSCPIVTE